MYGQFEARKQQNDEVFANSLVFQGATYGISIIAKTLENDDYKFLWNLAI